MAENRYFKMIYLLMEKGSMTAPELAKHFEVSVRTVYRDIDVLSAAGIPISATQGKGGGISIQDSFILNKSLISEPEQTQILMALQGISIVENENVDALLSKLSGVFKKKNVSWIEVDFSDWIRDQKYENVFDLLKTAIFQSKRVTFRYSSDRGESVNRLVEPLKLVFKNRDWFLYGYCCLREDYRLFKLSRIKEIETSFDCFSRPIPARIFGEAEQYQDESISLTLLFEKESAFRVYDNFDTVFERDDGKLLVNVCIPNNEWLYSFLLSFGDQVEVITPMTIRDEIINRIKKLQDKYIT